MFENKNEIKDTGQLKKLIHEAQNSNEGFNKLCEVCLTPVYRYILLRVRHKETAEDLTQTVFLKAFNSLSKFREIGKSPLAWLFTIARNTIIDFFRANGKVQIESDEMLAFIPVHDNFVEQLDIKQDVKLIKNLLTNLSPEQQEVLILKFINDLTNKEISALLSKSEESIRQLQSRGLKNLKKMAGQ